MTLVPVVRARNTRNAVVPELKLSGFQTIMVGMSRLLKNSVIAILISGPLVMPVSADIYKYRDAEGRIYFSDEPMRGNYRLLQRFGMNGQTKKKGQSKVNYAAVEVNKQRFSPLIETVAKETLIRPELLHAIIRAESAYDPNAVSHKGAVGLMQLMPGTAQRYGVSDRRNPQQNLRGGATYFRDLLIQFDFDLKLAIAAYNAGENAVIRSGNKIPNYQETQNYVVKVLRFYRQNRLDNS
ncbi:MAG: lytic transglycosylase domain-containing protein [Gammaproteobacteria bacterium]|nr:lytic transglycosylase domain-containing protein [Gammaproteobacteria bacterium]